MNTRAWFVEVLRRASEMPGLRAENTKVIDNFPSGIGKFYERRGKTFWIRRGLRLRSYHDRTGHWGDIISPMSKPRRNTPFPSRDDPLAAAKQRKAVPHEFVLDAIASLWPRTHPMFGCLAVYVEDKIVLILRDKREDTADNGVWLATTEEYHESLRRKFPNMRSIQVF